MPRQQTICRLDRKPGTNEFPASYAQERLWFVDQLEPGGVVFNEHGAIRIKGNLDLHAMEGAINGIIERHEVLRTTFATTQEGQPIQVIHEQRWRGLPVVDLAKLPDKERERLLQELIEEESERTFDLAKGPLIRVKLARLGEADYALFYTMHHIVSDGWSMGVWARELGLLYESFVTGEPSPLPALPIQYADYAVWQKEWLKGKVLEEQLAYWRKQFDGMPAGLELPTDRLRRAMQSHAGAAQVRALGSELTTALKALSQKQGVTLFMTLLAAFRVLLQRYTSQNDIVVGSPIANRNRTETEGLIGFFLNTIVLRNDLAGDPTFLELLGREKEVSFGAYKHQDMPIDMLVQALQPERNSSYSSLFQIYFNFVNVDAEMLKLPGLEVKMLEYGVPTQSKFDLTIYASELAGQLRLNCVYKTELFDSSTIERLLGHWQRLLVQIVANPGRKLSELGLLSPEEQRQLLVDWNNTHADYPREKSIHELIEQQAERTPQAIAVVCKRAKLTYRELNEKANQLGNYFLEAGVGKGSCVPVLMEAGTDLVVSLLAILKTGAAFVPLDSSWPTERLKPILEELDSIVVVDTKTMQLPCVIERHKVIVDEELTLQRLGNLDGRNLCKQVLPEEAIYVIYTSGSTGKPKGVIVPHRGITNRFLWMTQYFGDAAAASVLQITRHVYDSAVWQFFWPLISGGKTVIPPADFQITSDELGSLIHREKVTMTDLVPSVFNSIVPRLAGDELIRERFKTLRVLVIGGEEITASSVYTFRKYFPNIRTINLYGPTEASIGCIAYEITGLEGARIPIGRPIANVKVLILDEKRNLVPARVAGELYLAGKCLGLGYFNDPDKTNEAFVDNPFPELGYAKLYKTGDLARYLSDGNIEFLGRADHQVKIRGFRIELGEIESVLSQHPAVQQNLVMMREDKPGAKQLVGYVAVSGGRDDVGIKQLLKEYLRAKLPEYMVPVAFVVLDQLPLMPNGKVNRKALPAPERTELAQSYLAPRTAVEELLVGVFAEVLKVEKLGVHDNFFELGGHSLLATQLMSRVREVFKVEMPLKDLFEAPTVAGLSQRVEAWRAGDQPLAAPGIRRITQGQTLPLSYAQERLWFIDQLQPGSTGYNIAGALWVRGHLKVVELERAINEVVRRHETLRTIFQTREEGPVQVICKHQWRSLPIVDLTGLPDGKPELTAQELIKEESERPFNLSKGPLLRVTLLRSAEQEHLVMLTMHHIVSDWWSMEVLNREVGLLYEAFAKGQPSPLPELPIQYVDYAVWQRSWLQGEVLEKHVEHWRQELAGAPELIELPTDRVRQPVQSFRGGRLSFEISQEISERLSRLCSREGLTLYMGLQAAFQVLLYRYSGQEDLVISTGVGNRNHAETEDLIGCFINTVLMRTNLSGNPKFGELLKQVREGALRAYAHQELPFEKLVQELQPHRDLSHNPLTQVMLVLLNASATELDKTEGLEIVPVRIDDGGTQLDLTLHMMETRTGLSGRVMYNSDLFERATIERMMRSFVALLSAATEHPGCRIGELPLMSLEEQEQIVEEWNRSEGQFDGPYCLHERIEGQVRGRGGVVAVIYGEQAVSYEELNRRANRLANYLRRQGVGRGGIVGLCVQRSVEMVVAILGVLKAGAAYAPLDPEHPRERLERMLQDAGAGVLLTQSRFREVLAGYGGRRIELDRENFEGESAENPVSGAGPEDLAYVIYTSGSAGVPKGIEIRHGGVSNNIMDLNRRFGVGPGDRVLGLSSLSFDMSVYELVGMLESGATVVIPEGEAGREPVKWAELIRRHGVTIWNSAPALLKMLVETVEHQPEWWPRSLRLVLLGGDWVPLEMPGQLKEMAPGVRVIVMGGATEASIHSSLYEVQESNPEWRSIPYGRPMANQKLYVLNRQMQAVPAGVGGELYLGGVGLARGYHGRAELTAEKFVPNPFAAAAGERLYRTGDLVKWHANGELELLGRIDFQVKIRGYRIELGEVEGALRRCQGVKQAMVMAREDFDGKKQLVGYVVPTEGGRLNDAERREELKRYLPEYMIPAAVVVLESFPLTPNGKLDRKALPTPEWTGSEEMSVAPRNAVEELLVGVFGEVLKVGRVGVHDSFFELGGHSLLATQLVSRVRELFDVELPLKDLFESPTVAGLSKRVEAKRGDEVAFAGAAIRPVGRDAALPLSYAQERLWFIDQLVPGTTGYNMPGVVRMQGGLDVGALEKAVNEIIRRHESLRTRFEVDRLGKPVQVINAYKWQALPVVDLTGLSDQDRELTAKQLIKEESGRLFDLAHGPLVRVRLLQFNPQEMLLSYTLHHVISDGWSMGVLNRELEVLYEAFAKGQPSPLEELLIQYADFAVWQRQWLQGEALERQLEYWKGQLDGVSPLQLSADHPRPVIQTFNGGKQALKIGLEMTGKLRSLCRANEVTLFMTLLAGFEILLGRYSGQEDIAVGTPIANRTRGEIEGLIGFFVNTLVMRTKLNGDPTVRELLKRVREMSLGAYGHQDLPFEKLVEEMQPERDLGRNPLVGVLFALQNAPDEGVEMKGVDLQSIGGTEVPTRFDLEVHLWEHPHGLDGWIIYNTDLFEPGRIERMAGHLERLLGEMVGKPEGRLSELEILGGEERRQLLEGWNDTQREYPRNRCIHELIEEQAERTPGAVAVVCGEQRLTYRELNEKSNQLAHYLRGLGVGPEVLVGICVERSLEMVVGLLGILKAGGAYVPLDPKYPKERLAFICEDTRISMLLTQQKLAAHLPAQNARIVCLDGSLPGSSGENPIPLAGAGTLAYIIYTSGSTGRPKGVAIEHHSTVARLDWVRQAYSPEELSGVLASTSICFDLSIFELFGPLANGGKVILVENVLQLAGSPLAGEVTLINTVPSAMAELLRQNGIPALARTVNLAGEALKTELVQQIYKTGTVQRVYDLYGPSEDTTYSTGALRRREGPATIGRPIANTRVYLLDQHCRPVPLGMAGEICIGGAGLARGYLNRPELTAEKFIPDPYSPEGGRRMYRTGDLGRYLAEGNLEFLGRADHQVKIRGFRIELGEVESLLGQHPQVREAVVVAREDQPGDRRLVGYVVMETEGEGSASVEEEKKVKEWQGVFDDHLYGRFADPVDPTFNIVGWESSFTGEPIPAQEMREWLQDTIASVQGCMRGGRLLEIGCGTGLLLFKLAGGCQEYWGTDFSPQALAYIERQLIRVGLDASHVKLLQREASDFEGLEGFNGIILNSVAQYFPDMEYLVRVVEGAVKCLTKEGFIFLGDIRSLPLLEAYEASVQLYKAQEGMTVDELRQRVSEQVRQENELLVDPGFFKALMARIPGIEHVEVRPKTGRALNELTQFRYNVILHVGKRPPLGAVERWEQLAKGEETIGEVRRLLEKERAKAIGFRGLANKRVRWAIELVKRLEGVEAMGSVSRLKEALAQDAAGGVEPEELYKLGGELGYEVEISWAGHDKEGRYDAAFWKKSISEKPNFRVDFGGAAESPRSWQEYGNDPVMGKRMKQVVPQLKSYLQEKLPEHMVPSAIVILEKMPLTANGKVARKALPKPDRGRMVLAEGYVGARNPVEARLVGIWREVLGLERVGVHDNFFELGGDSILSIQIIARANSAGLKLTPRQLFEHQTVARLAEVAGSGEERLADQGNVSGEVELTPIQRWFFEQELEESRHYNQAVMLEVREGLAGGVVEAVVKALVKHHDALRMRYERASGQWRQINAEVEENEIFVRVDLSGVEAAEQSTRLTAEAERAQRGLDLGKGPVIRVVWYEMGLGKAARLLMVIHHLVVDGVSWRILLEDLQKGCESLRAKGEVEFKSKTSSYQQWAKRLKEYAQGQPVEKELEYWQGLGWENWKGMPVDIAGGENRVRSMESVGVWLGEEETRALLQEVPEKYHTQINDVTVSRAG